MSWNNQNVLVTGSTGFIGKHLVYSLINLGARVTGLSTSNSNYQHKNYTHLVKRINDPLELDKYSYIFHLAGVFNGAIITDEMHKINVKGLVNLLDSIKDPSSTKLIFSSSCSVYGHNSTEKMSEEIPLNPISVYAKNKVESENIIKYFSNKSKMKFAIARIFNVYGIDESKSIVSKMYLSSISKKSFPINLEIVRDFIHISDVVLGLLQVAKNGAGIFNLGTGKGVDMEYLSLFFKNKNKLITTPSNTSLDIQKSSADIFKLKSIGWNPLISIKDGLVMYNNKGL